MPLPQFVRRSYNGGAKALRLLAPINATTLSFAATGTFTTWPTGTTGPFTVDLTRGFSTEEKVLMSALSSTTNTHASPNCVAAAAVSSRDGFDDHCSASST